MRILAVTAIALAAGCGASRGGASAATPTYAVPDVSLVGASGEPIATHALLLRSPLTVLVFYSPECHVLAAHGDRLRALYESDARRGVQLVMVDSEVRLGMPDCKVFGGPQVRAPLEIR